MRLRIALLALSVSLPIHAEPLQLFVEKRLLSPATEQIAFDLPAVAAGQQARLSLKARVDTPTFGGHNPFLAVAVNGQTVQPTQLANKPVEFTMYDGSDASWWGQGMWRLLYSPGFDAFFKEDPPQYMIADADPYLFVWDITPYVKAGANTLTLSHPKLLITPTTCVVGEAAVEVGAPLPPPTTGGQTAGKLTDVYVPAAPKPVAMDVQAFGGSITVTTGGRKLLCDTETLQPGSGWRSETMGGLGGPIRRGYPGGGTWDAGTYIVERRVEVRADHVHVADKITNKSDHVIGVPIRYILHLTNQGQPQRLLGGRPVYKASQTSWSPGNPTAMAIWPDLAVGLVAEDDILRVHNDSYSDPDGIGLSDMKLGFAPGASHTLEWSIYPVPRGNYWDFINAIRRNWGCNDITIPGPSCIESIPDGAKSVEAYRRWAANRSLAFAIAGQQMLDDGKLAEGTAIPLGNKWNAGFRLWREKMHQVAPGFKALTYLHSEISTEADCQTKYADCRVLDAAGKQQVSPYYYPVYLFIPRPDNSYGPALMKAVEFMLDDLQADGIYNDCFTYDSVPWTWGGQWDGCTVSIDPKTRAVGEKYSSVVLLQQPWKVQLARAVRSRGKLLIGNGALFTRTMLQEKIPTFTETSSFSFLIDTHLSCPWGLGTHSAEQNLATRAYMARRMLDYGGVYSVYAWGDDPPAETFIRDFFPTTPIELRPGVVIAQERILTNRSGRFGWGDASRAQVHVYDVQGQAVANPSVNELRQGGKVLYEVQVPPNGFAALLRRK